MAIKKNTVHNILVLSLAILISILIIRTGFKKSYNTPNLASKVYYSVKGWGYDILINNKVIIHQDIVPAIQTQHGFGTEVQARRAAKLVIERLKSGKPPSLSVSDIKTLSD